jgi:hypothetical protein
MLIDQALDATTLLSTLCLFNVIFSATFTAITLQFYKPQRKLLMFILLMVDIAGGCLYPLILLGLETFNPLDPMLVQIALALGVGLPSIMLVIALVWIVRR